jgi:hypothetical protein
MILWFSDSLILWFSLIISSEINIRILLINYNNISMFTLILLIVISFFRYFLWRYWRNGVSDFVNRTKMLSYMIVNPKYRTEDDGHFTPDAIFTKYLGTFPFLHLCLHLVISSHISFSFSSWSLYEAEFEEITLIYEDT